MMLTKPNGLQYVTWSLSTPSAGRSLYTTPKSPLSFITPGPHYVPVLGANITNISQMQIMLSSLICWESPSPHLRVLRYIGPISDPDHLDGLSQQDDSSPLLPNHSKLRASTFQFQWKRNKPSDSLWLMSFFLTFLLFLLK